MYRSSSENLATGLWDKTWRDKRGRIVIWQTPSLPLLAWVGLTIASLVTSGRLSDVFYWLGTLSLLIWSVLEITTGVNYFRRGLGLVVLALAIASGINSL